MTLGEIRAWVLRTIKRPELTQEALDAINAAIEYATANGDFAWDLVEGSLAISPNVASQSIVISTSFPRFRKIAYLKPNGYNLPLERIRPGKGSFLKPDGSGIQVRTNCWYRAGDNIVFQLTHSQATMQYGYFQFRQRYTDLNEEDDYMANMPSVLHALACSFLFADIGNEAESARHERRALKMLQQKKYDLQDG